MKKEKLNKLYEIMKTYKATRISDFEKIDGIFLNIESANYELNSGEIITREELVKKSGGHASVIIPITTEGEVILTVQPRVVTKEMVGIEFPAGYVDEGETYLEAAERELLEETGYIAGEMTELTSYYQDQGCMRSFNTCFLATDCVKVADQSLDKDEFIKLFKCSLEEVEYLFQNGILDDANSIIAYLSSKPYVKRRRNI